MRVFLLLLCVFVAGVFVGIWLDWSAPKPGRSITYVVEPNQQANLKVFAGDQIQLADGTGKQTDWMVSFLGDSPCVGATNPATPVSLCKIAPNLDARSSYAFACTSGNESGCPDPGIQPSSTTPINFGYWTQVGLALHLTNVQLPPVVTGGPRVEKAVATSTSPTYQAWVYCNPQTKLMSVLDTNGDPVTDIAVSNGQTVNWGGTYPFTLAATNYHDGFCSGGKPDVTNQRYAQCVVNQSKQMMKYTVQSQTCNTLDGLSVTSQ